MLIEIILAFVIAMGITYFMFELIIKIKNKNDDLLVKTLVSTDQTIIYNTIINDIYKGKFSCGKIDVDGNKFIYDGKPIVVVSEYASVGSLKCNDDRTEVHIPIRVKQIPNENFDVKISDFDVVAPICSLSVGSDNVITATYSDNANGSGIIYYGWDSSCTGENSDKITITDAKEYVFYVMDGNKNKGQCRVYVEKTSVEYTCRKNRKSDSYSCDYTPSVKTYNSNRLCENACSGVCVAEECMYCPNGGSYSSGICDKTCTSYYCEDEWKEKNKKCYLYNQSSCPSDTYYSETYNCVSDGFIKTSDNAYCYKIN